MSIEERYYTNDYPQMEVIHNSEKWGNLPWILLQGNMERFVAHLEIYNYTDQWSTPSVIDYFRRMLSWIDPRDLAKIIKNLPSFAYNLIATNRLGDVSPSDIKALIGRNWSKFDLGHFAALNWHQVSEIEPVHFIRYIRYHMDASNAATSHYPDLSPIFGASETPGGRVFLRQIFNNPPVFGLESQYWGVSSVRQTMPAWTYSIVTAFETRWAARRIVRRVPDASEANAADMVAGMGPDELLHSNSTTIAALLNLLTEQQLSTFFSRSIAGETELLLGLLSPTDFASVVEKLPASVIATAPPLLIQSLNLSQFATLNAPRLVSVFNALSPQQISSVFSQATNNDQVDAVLRKFDGSAEFRAIFNKLPATVVPLCTTTQLNLLTDDLIAARFNLFSLDQWNGFDFNLATKIAAAGFNQYVRRLHDQYYDDLDVNIFDRIFPYFNPFTVIVETVPAGAFFKRLVEEPTHQEMWKGFYAELQTWQKGLVSEVTGYPNSF